MNHQIMVQTAADHLKNSCGNDFPSLAIVLGSGLNGLADRVENPHIIKYETLPGFSKPGVLGHRGTFIFGKLSGRNVVLAAGRFHLYEGHPWETVVLPVRTLARAGVKSLILTNAAGGIDTTFVPGELMLITDHINLTGGNPLAGENIEQWGPRFPDMSRIYDVSLRKKAKDQAEKLGFSLREGVYAGLLGPSYETPAEICALRMVGAAAVGMSTVGEAIAARHMGLSVLGISCITNMAAGILPQPLTHEEVLTTSAAARERFEALITALSTAIK